MFNATAGQQRLTDAAETSSDDFAAWFGTLDTRQQANVAKALAEAAVSNGADGLIARLTGATPTVTAPAAPALPPGTPAPTPGQMATIDHLNAILADSSVDAGIRAALQRMLVVGDPNPIRVGPDGTPVELVSARRERDDAKAERDAAKAKLAEARDPNKSGSLAHQLATAQAAAAVPAGLVDKAAVRAEVDKIKAGWATAHPARTNADKSVIDRPQDATAITEGLTALERLV